MTVIVLRDKLKIDETENQENLLKKTKLFFSGRFRWNIFVFLLATGLIILPIVIPIIATLVINCYFILIWFLYLVFNTYGNFKIWRTINKYKQADEESVPQTVKSKHRHIMVTFVYKEPLAMLKKNLQMVLSLNGGKEVIMVICLEEKTPELGSKMREIESEFDNKFEMLIITVHPYGVEGDIPGKCSNSNFGIRSLNNYLTSLDPLFNTSDYILTNFDVDTVFHKNFLDILTQSVIENEAQLSRIVFQPLLFYNWNLDKLSFFTRIIGIMRSTMMCGALVPFNLNIMSVYSASLKLWVDGGFTHPFYQMDDIICYIRWMIVSKQILKIKPIYSPTLSGPTSGENWRKELFELVRQGKRWSIGSAEVFHYFMVKLGKINLFYGFIWAINYLNYYVVILCVQSLMIFTITIRLTVMDQGYSTINIILLAFPVINYAFNLWMIMINNLAVKSFLKDLDVKENFGFFRQLAHWLLCFPTQIFYSFIVLYGFVEILIYGKEVCSHKPSKKENLVRKESIVVKIFRRLSRLTSSSRAYKPF
jgi:hypothetical protein